MKAIVRGYVPEGEGVISYTASGEGVRSPVFMFRDPFAYASILAVLKLLRASASISAVESTANLECPPSRVMRRRERTTRYPRPIGAMEAPSQSPPDMLSTFAKPDGANRIPSPVLSAIIYGSACIRSYSR